MQHPRLFVYGTLRRGSLAVLSDQPGESVPGELYQLQNPSILSTLDEYEGPEFERVQITVSLDNGQDVETWVYLFRGARPRRAAFTLV